MVYAVVATVPVGSFTFGVGVNASTNRIYVSDVGGNAVSVIDGMTDTVLAYIPVARPSGVAVNPSTNRVYVVGNSFGASFVRVIDGTDNSVVATIPVAGLPQPIAVDSTTNLIYLVDSVGRTCCPQPDSTLHVISGDSNSIVASIPVGKFSLDVAVNQTTSRVYVANTDSSTVSVIDGGTNTIVDTIALPSPVALGVNPTTNRVYVAHSTAGGPALSVIDGATDAIITTIPAPAVVTTGAVAVDAIANRVYVTGFSTDTVAVVDGVANVIVATIPIDKNNACSSCAEPVGVGVNATTGRVYVADYAIGSFSVIDLVAPQAAVQLLIDQVNNLVYTGVLTASQAGSLNVTLGLVRDKLAAGDTQGAMNALKILDNAFINKVQALINSGSLTRRLGQSLIDEANSLSNQIGAC